ncbi:nuclear transport factor 2 family protein [Streptomyces sp. NPDC015346]|uniref:nuclear transport factor 2 family protein n=1 Tax=Streptomyces sp. NPDC015346 TaxID=3364954 RepID=UPI0036FAE821
MRAVTAACAAALVLALAGTTAACGTSPTPRPADAPDAARRSQSPSPSSGPLDPAAQRYLDAVAAKDADAVAAAFAADAVVVDVGREIRGRAAIRQWAADEVVGGVYTLLGHTPRTNGTTMLVRFQPGGTGGFRAAYSFDIADGLITRADLQYA